TNRFTDTYFTNGHAVIQPVQRIAVQPDILFLVQDLGLNRGFPVSFSRSGTATWQNNDLINGYSTLAGPGVIQPQVRIFFSELLPYFINQSPDFLDEMGGSKSFVWGSFDGTTNAPITFPS